jgi:transcriptional regulator NrdR family protein
MTCPKCKTSEVRRSRELGLGDLAAGWILRKPYRCLGCKTRFRAYTPQVDTKEVRKRLRKIGRSKANRRELVMYGIASVIVAAIIYLIVQQRFGGG